MYYFAYGSNMDEDRMKRRGVRFFRKLSGILHGHNLEFDKVSSKNENEGKANVVPDEDNIVEGVLYEIKDGDISKLDEREVCPEHYVRMQMDIETKEGTKKAEIYIANKDKIKTGLKPTKEYLSHLLAGKKYLSDQYYAKLMSWPTLDQGGSK